MFSTNESLFKLSVSKVSDCCTDLNNKKSIITNLIAIEDDYVKKNDVLKVCNDINNLTSNITNLLSDMKVTESLFSFQNGISDVDYSTLFENLNCSFPWLLNGGVNGYDNIMANLEAQQQQEFEKMLDEYNLSETDRNNIARWIQEENIGPIIDTIVRSQKAMEKSQKEQEKEDVDSRINYLEMILEPSIVASGNAPGVGMPLPVGFGTDSMVQEAKDYLEANKDNKEAIKGMTFEIAGKKVRFHSYNEGMYYVEHFSEILSAELAMKRGKSGELKSEIKDLNKTISYLDNDIEFLDKYQKVYEVPQVENKFFLQNTNLDLQNCTVREAFSSATSYLQYHPDYEYSNLNIYSIIEMVRENPLYKDMSDEDFYDLVYDESLSYNRTILTSTELPTNKYNEVTYDIDKNKYIYMTKEEREAYGRARLEGAESGENYLDLLSVRSLNMREGTAKGYQMFNDIVSHPTKFGEMANAYGDGGWLGLVGHFQNVYGLVTDDYSMSTNDWAIQTMQSLFYTMGKSYDLVDESGLDEFEKSYAIDANKEQELREKIANGEEIRYYELLGYVDPQDGGLTSEQVEEQRAMFNQINGGEFYTNVVLKSAFLAGISTGNMVPSIALGFIPKVGPYLSKASFFLSVAGSEYKEQRRKGATWLDSMYAAAANGTLEVGTEYLIGGIPFLSRGFEGTKTFGEFLKMPFTGKLLLLGKSVAGEEIEETFQATIGEGIMGSITGEKVDLQEIKNQLPETWLSTLMSTTAINSMTYGVNTVFNYGDTIINITPNEWASLCQDGFDLKIVMDYINNKVVTNIDNKTNESIVNGLNKQLEKNGVDLKFEYDNGKVKVNGIELTESEFNSLVDSKNNQVNLTKLPEILESSLSFDVLERNKLDALNPNWRNEMSISDALKNLNPDNPLYQSLDDNSKKYIDLFENTDLSNKRQIIEAIVNDKEFRQVIDVFKLNNTLHDNEKLEKMKLIGFLQQRLGTDYDKMRMVTAICFAQEKLSNKAFNMIESADYLIQDDNYYNFYKDVLIASLNLINKTSTSNVNDLFNNNTFNATMSNLHFFYIRPSYLYEHPDYTNAYLMHEIDFCNDASELHKFILNTLFHNVNINEFIKLDSDKLGNDMAKYSQNTLKILLESDDPNFIRTELKNIIQTYGYTNFDKTIRDSIVYYRLDGIREGQLTDITTLRHETKTYNGKNVDVYYTDGKDFTFITHSIMPMSDRVGVNKHLTTKLVSNPNLWEAKEVNGNELLSLTTTYKRNDRFRTSYDSYDSIILGFNGIPNDQILVIKNNDATTPMKNPKAYSQYDSPTLFEEMDTVQDFIDGKSNTYEIFYSYNEIVATRYLPNGEKRLPDFILISKQGLSNSVYDWATYYKIPIVVINK